MGMTVQKTKEGEIIYFRTAVSPSGTESGSGMYITPLKEYARDYLDHGEKGIVALTINPEAKVFKAKNVEALYQELYNSGEIKVKNIYPLDSYGEPKILDSEQSLDYYRKAERRINKAIKKRGFDVIEYAEESRDNFFESKSGVKPMASVVLNPKIAKPYTKKITLTSGVKTKSQLTDIWNKAHEGPEYGPTIAREARKYETKRKCYTC